MPTVLVVDDSPVDQRIVSGLLERQADLDWLVEFAGNGREALETMQDLLPDAVVTDLQMPEMDGLELVTAIGSTHPSVPVILVTGQGSESIAMEALERGAASYVPKQRLAERLMPTLNQVIATARADLGHQRVSERIRDAHLTLSLENEETMIRAVVDYFQDLLADMKFRDKTERVHVAIALEEAIFNAMFHGNLELSKDEVRQARSYANRGAFLDSAAVRRSQPPYRDRRVTVQAFLSPSKVQFVVADEGPGFSLDRIPKRGDPTVLEESAGRGLVLMRNFMDEVIYNDAGSQVTLVRGS